MDFGCFRILNHRPSRWLGGARLLPPSAACPVPSLIRYPATAELTAQLVLVIFFPFFFGAFSVRSLDYFWLTWTVDVYTGFNKSVTHFCLFLASYCCLGWHLMRWDDAQVLVAAHAGLTCRLCLGIHIPHALGVGVGHVLINLHVILVTVGHWINGNIIVLNALMLGAVNHLPAMLATPLKQPPTLPCPRPPWGPFRPRLSPNPSPLPQRDWGKGARLLM